MPEDRIEQEQEYTRRMERSVSAQTPAPSAEISLSDEPDESIEPEASEEEVKNHG